MTYSDITTIPGIEELIANEFSKIEINCIADLKEQDPDHLFTLLQLKNRTLSERTNPLLLYLLRMAVYYANGGRESQKLTWSAWR